jgi:hypothetical protein
MGVAAGLVKEGVGEALGGAGSSMRTVIVDRDRFDSYQGQVVVPGVPVSEHRLGYSITRTPKAAHPSASLPGGVQPVEVEPDPGKGRSAALKSARTGLSVGL